jgi:hypothetical protein
MLKRYIVKLETPEGGFELEVPSTRGADAAGRHAFWTAAAKGWGDVDEVHITSITEMEE